MRKYILYAGVNGAGKSTLYMTTHYKDMMPRVNTDEILREFGDWRNTSDLMKAGRIAVERLNSYLSEGITFNQETTLCGHSILRTIYRAKQLGYVIELHYVCVDSPAIAKKRIAERVKMGGHGIPDKDVEKRFGESLRNLHKIIDFVIWPHYMIIQMSFAGLLFIKMVNVSEYQRLSQSGMKNGRKNVINLTQAWVQ